MSVTKQSKFTALAAALACSTCLFWAASASAMDDDHMSDQSTTGMQDDKAAEGHSQGMKHEDGMSHDNKMESDRMSPDDKMSGEAMKGDKGESHDGMSHEDKM